MLAALYIIEQEVFIRGDAQRFCMRRLQRWLKGDISMVTYLNRQITLWYQPIILSVFLCLT